MITEPFYILSNAIVNPADDPGWNSIIPPMMKRKDPRIWQMSYVAATRACREEFKCKSIVIATALGALDETKNFLDGVYTEGFGSPRNFIASVHNSMGGKIALDLKIQGPNLTVCDSQNSFASAIMTINTLTDDCFPALLIVVDENIGILDQMNPHFSAECSNHLKQGWTEAAIAFVIDKKSTNSKGSIRAAGPVPIYDLSPEEAYKKLLSECKIESIIEPDFKMNSTSFVQPALNLCNCLQTGKYYKILLESYSPSTKSIAVVEYQT
jgi:hypothetical protein